MPPVKSGIAICGKPAVYPIFGRPAPGSPMPPLSYANKLSAPGMVPAAPRFPKPRAVRSRPPRPAAPKLRDASMSF